MTKEITDAKILVVEDHKNNKDSILRSLKGMGVPLGNIDTTDNAVDAKEKIDDFEPDVLLLDLNIMNEKGGEEEIKYGHEVIEKVRLFNHENPEKIKIIVISGMVKDTGLQNIVGTEGENITKFIDKGLMSSDMDAFNEKLKKSISKALRSTDEGDYILFQSIRNSTLKILKKLHIELYMKIEEEILDNIEKLNLRKVNEHTLSKNIIISCGQVVEFTVSYLEGEVRSIRELKLYDNPKTIRNKLNHLSGRKFDESSKAYEIIDKDPVISRKASEYAYRAYSFRNQASHTPEADEKNKNIYKDTRFDKWDAKIAVDLIMPLLNEYIKLLKEKNTG